MLSPEKSPLHILRSQDRASLYYEQSRAAECREVLENGQATGIVLRSWTGKESAELLSIFAELPLREIVVLNDILVEPKEWYRCSQITYLQIGESKARLDTTRFPNLRDLRGNWSKKLVLPEPNSSLRGLMLYGYKTHSRTLKEIPKYPALTRLEFVRGNLVLLDGVEEFPSLDFLDLAYMRALVDVSAAIGCSARQIGFQNCPHVKGIEALARCSNLNFLRLSKCPPMKSLKFVHQSKTLRKLSFVHTTIEDGDMTPLFDLEYAGFMDKRTYSHSAAEVKEQIRCRQIGRSDS